MKTVPITIEIPVLQPFYWLAAFGMAIFVLAWLAARWPERHRLLAKLPRHHERPSINAVIWTAIGLSPVWFVLFALTLTGLFELWFSPPDITSEGANENTLRLHYLALAGLTTVLAGLVSAPLVLLRVQNAERQTKAQEEGLVTDRINKAVEGLGADKLIKRQRRRESGKLAYEAGEDGKPDLSKPMYEESTEPNLEVRIGAIYALERIARHNLNEHIQIMEILCAYVRENARAASLEPTADLSDRPTVRADIQTALTVIGRRSMVQIRHDMGQQFRLDLSGSDLSGADLSRANLSAALLIGCRLEATAFRDSKLNGTVFVNSLLNHANFFNAKLVGTNFNFVTLTLPEVPVGGMSDSIIMADLDSITIVGADLSAINYLGEDEKRDRIFGSRDTKLNRQLDFDRENFEQLSLSLRASRRSNDESRTRQIVAQMRQLNMFLNWCPFDSTDGAIGTYYHNFLDQLGLDGWPYR